MIVCGKDNPLSQRGENEWTDRNFGKAVNCLHRDQVRQTRTKVIEYELWKQSLLLGSTYSEFGKKRPDLTKNSKWYEVKPKKRLEITVLAWMLRFVSNAKKGQCEPQGRELLPEESRAAEEQTIKMAQLECFPDDIKVRLSNKPIPKRSPLLPWIVRLSPKENTCSRPFTEVKPYWTGLISGWVTIQ